MSKSSDTVKKTVTKLANNKKSKQSNEESKTLQKLGSKMSAANNSKELDK